MFVPTVIGNLLDAAVAKRAGMLDGGTNAVRLVDGAGDGVPGFALEEYAGRWMAMTPGGEIKREVKDWLKASGRSVYWKRLDQHQKESPMHLYGEAMEGAFAIRENGLGFEVSFQSGYSQGIFLDQRKNRAEVMRRMAGGGKLLNLFSYTGGFSVAGAMCGGETTTLDLSAPYLEWAKRNFQMNGLDVEGQHFCKGDAFHWLKRFAKQGRVFDGIVIDPPTFSRDEKGKVFRVEKDFGELSMLAGKVLAKGGWMLCCTNFRGISESDFMKMIARPEMEGVVMPEDFPEEAYLKSVWCE
ncbi:MAG: class I SAM-dependent methyltransferase [Akkermansiaceae bacterium]|nr:class I SAM-dependent methyltransferase [Akkermansiaceae bacterium]MDP4646888.1 class I SAM-dependent methyltransferase [Akkermansiaceae bacterium]MDP4781219.1 class I SAM-dependent methyltransferase [Akkermansiaceae bacterium]MDP4899009.1 class I SAM-dependent methyltransferase [Akkermansiaceae bacterium]